MKTAVLLLFLASSGSAFAGGVWVFTGTYENCIYHNDGGVENTPVDGATCENLGEQQSFIVDGTRGWECDPVLEAVYTCCTSEAACPVRDRDGN